MSLQHETSFIFIPFFDRCAARCIVGMLKIAFEASWRPAWKKVVVENHLWELPELKKTGTCGCLLPANSSHCQAPRNDCLFKQESLCHTWGWISTVNEDEGLFKMPRQFTSPMGAHIGLWYSCGNMLKTICPSVLSFYSAVFWKPDCLLETPIYIV